MKKTFLAIVTLLVGMTTSAQTLSRGGQFMDLLLPMEGCVAATESDWGTTAGENTQYSGTWEGTLGRWKDNGIEDTERSYWGGNIIKGDDGKYHIYVAGWPSATCGHMAWSSASRVYHVTADNVWGPYTYVSDIGSGHNPEIYKTGDTYVIYRIEPLGYYKSTTLGDTWESGEYDFDLRGRILIAGEDRETSLSNCSFAKREDGSFMMIDRGGGIWVSSDGLTDPWHQLTDASVYLNSVITDRGSFEDPVIWRDHLQYHMVVNAWRPRQAYYYRSLDGLHWVMEAGKAYTGQDPFARHANGDVEAWHKYERPRVYQDELGRAIRMNFAVIDCVKQSDVAGDDHSSKNINMPLTKQLLLEVQGDEAITASTTSIRVLVKAETGFNPRTDLNLASLKFGSHDKVNYGNGFSYSSSEPSGETDLIITFTGTAGASGISESEWAGKMLGEKTDGSIAFGYAKMPGIDYQPAMLSALTPTFSAAGDVESVNVTNYGQRTSGATAVRIYAPDGTTQLAHGTTTALSKYATEDVTLTTDATAGTGYKSIQVRFYNGETLLNTENIPLTAINAVQAALQAVITEAETLYADATLPNGKDALNTAITAAKAVVTCYNIAALEAEQTTLAAALNTCKYANASPTNGQSITIPNATMDDLSGWTLTRLDATQSPGWKTNTKGAQYDGFDGNFMEYWVSQSMTLGHANRASQTLTEMPAGRYRLRATVIATRQNSGSSVTGVTLFANSQTATCATDKSGTPQEYMMEIELAEAGTLEIGLNVESTTTANWVAWDNVSLKYFGTQEGDIVEEEEEPLSFDPSKTYYIKWYNHTNYTKTYWRSPKYNTTGDAVLHRTATQAEAAHFIIRNVANTEGQFYLYDVVSHTYVVPSVNATNGTAWTASATMPGKTVITEGTGSFTISSTAGGYANAYANDNDDADVKNYGTGSQWIIEEAGDNTETMGIDPQAVYHLTHLNSNRYPYVAGTPSAEGYLLTTNTDSEKGEFSLLPVSNRAGYYYIYTREGYFVTPSASNWTLSKTAPAAVKIEFNIDNMDAIPTSSVTFLLGETSQHANPQSKNSVELVYAYADHPLDKGNNWVLEPIANIRASMNVTIGKTGYTTFACIAPLDLAALPEGTTAYYASEVNDNAVMMTSVQSAVAPGTGLVLAGTPGAPVSIPVARTGDAIVGNLLVGVTEQTVLPVSANDYVLVAGEETAEFQSLSENGITIPAGKAYLHLPSQAKQRLTFIFDGTSTSIETSEAVVPLATGRAIYNLRGQRVTSPTRGIYIIDGKKVLLR